MPVMYLITAAIILSMIGGLQLRLSEGNSYLSQISFWLFVGCVHGLLLKPAFFLMGYPQQSYYEDVILFNITSEAYWQFAFISLFYYSTLVLLVLITGNISKKSESISADTGNTYGLYFPITKIYVFGIVPILALFLFINKYGLYGIQGSKNDLATSQLEGYSSGTSLRIMIWLFYIFLIMTLSNIVVGYRKYESKAIFLFCLICWLFYCIISDARGLLIFSMIGLYSFHVYTGAKYNNSTKFFFICFACVFIFLSTANRAATEGLVAFEGLVSNLMGRNLLEISKGAHIYNAVDELGYTFGIEILDTLLLYVPREIYPEKSVVSADTFFGMAVFGCDLYGACAVPPGLLGEALFSIDWPFAILLLFVLGVTLGLLQKRIMKNQLNRFFIVSYFSLFLFAGLEIAGSGYTSYLRQFIVKFVIVLLLTGVWQKLDRRPLS